MVKKERFIISLGCFALSLIIIISLNFSASPSYYNTELSNIEATKGLVLLSNNEWTDEFGIPRGGRLYGPPGIEDTVEFIPILDYLAEHGEMPAHMMLHNQPPLTIATSEVMRYIRDNAGHLSIEDEAEILMNYLANIWLPLWQEASAENGAAYASDGVWVHSIYAMSLDEWTDRMLQGSAHQRHGTTVQWFQASTMTRKYASIVDPSVSHAFRLVSN